MELLHSRGTYTKGHGARLREERRKFAREEARTLRESRMAELERTEVGATRRLGIKEAGLRERLGEEQEFARPLQTAETRRIGARAGLREAEAGKVRYGTEVERGLRSTVEDIVGLKKEMGIAKTGEAKLSLREALREERLRDEAETEATEAAGPLDIEEEMPTAPARPARRMRPSVKRFLWEGTPTKFGLTLPGLGAPLYGYKNIADWIRGGMKKGYEYAFPGAR